MASVHAWSLCLDVLFWQRGEQKVARRSVSPAKDQIRNKPDATTNSSGSAVRLTLGKKNRLSSKKSIEELFKSGSSLRFQPFFLKYLPNSEGENRLLVAVPKKFHKKAVTRNLLKRRIREVWRQNQELLSEHALDVALVYQSREVLPFQEIQEKLINLMVRLRKKTPPAHVDQESK